MKKFIRSLLVGEKYNPAPHERRDPCSVFSNFFKNPNGAKGTNLPPSKAAPPPSRGGTVIDRLNLLGKLS